MTPMCERCGKVPAKPGDWMHCEECYQIVCNEIHAAEWELHDQERKDLRRVALGWHRAAKPPDLLLRVIRGRVPSLQLVDRQWCADCPWCDEPGQPFHVYGDIYHCFACEAHGDAIQFMMVMEGLRFLDAVQWLAAEAGMAPQ